MGEGPGWGANGCRNISLARTVSGAVSSCSADPRMVVKIRQQQSPEYNPIPGERCETMLANIGQQKAHDGQATQKSGHEADRKYRYVLYGQ
jgi:hypothetical protein